MRMKKFVGFFCVCLILFSGAVLSVKVQESKDTEVLDASDFSVSERMTFSEMVDHYAQNNGISYEEALGYFPQQSSSRSARDIYYRVFTAVLSVTDEYKPHLEFYCETAEGGNFRNINEIYQVELVRSYNGLVKQFSGSINTWLRGSQKIEYSVNGDFYNIGNTSVTEKSGVSVGVDELFTVGYEASITTTSNYYAYCYKHDWLTIGAG